MCAVSGVFGVPNAAALTVVLLHGNQHRARAYAGIVSSTGTPFFREAAPGKAFEVFNGSRLSRLRGSYALGHIRYPTGDDDVQFDNTQPVMGKYNGSWIAVAHNGNLPNKAELEECVPKGVLTTSMDTELIVRLLEEVDTGNIEEDLKRVFAQLKGAYALGILLPDMLIAVQGPSESHPLSVARLGEGYCISSEDCAYANVRARHLFDIKPGTMVFITKQGLREVRFAKPKPKRCLFEKAYFSHPASYVFGESVADFRERMGVILEEECPVIGGADIVIGVPASATPIAIGYGRSGRSGSCINGLYRHHNGDRTFTITDQFLIDMEVARKFIPDARKIKGKRVVLVDDSIVRGSTIPGIVETVWWCGATEVHVRIGWPPTKYSCHYGVQTSDRKRLASAWESPGELAEKWGLTSLEFMPEEALKRLSGDEKSYCMACVNGEYWA